MVRLSAYFVLTVLLAGCRAGMQQPVEPGHLSAGAERARVDLLAMGDWGTGSDRQKSVADAMRDYVRSVGVKFSGILLAGDNFYVRLRGVDDPQWQTLFERMYDPQVLDFPFYVALGNHDNEDNKVEIELAYARENPDSRWKLPSRWYRIDFPKDDPLLTVFMLDSDRDLMGRDRWHAQNAWLRDQLRSAQLGRWVVCCAHHPLFSNGDHGDNGALQRYWGPLFEEHGVDFYVCGHDHDLQHISKSPDGRPASSSAAAVGQKPGLCATTDAGRSRARCTGLHI